MKKSLIAVAVTMAALPAAALAQSSSTVTLYGILDTGVARYDNGGSKNFGLSTGTQSASRWGLRGSEDLGGGLRGIFNLESRLFSDNGFAGPSASGTDNQLFDRTAILGLAGGFGELKMGRQTLLVADSVAFNTVTGVDLFGNPLTTGITLRANNTVRYSSPIVAGARAEVMYGFGAENDTLTNNTTAGSGRGIADRYVAARLNYSQGPVTANAAISRQVIAPAGATVGTFGRKEWTVGGQYDFGAFRLAATYLKLDNALHTAASSSEGAETRVGIVGVAVPLAGGQVRVQGTVLRAESATGADSNAKIYALAYDYPLSKRTNVYASYGTTRNDSGASVALASANQVIVPAAAGRDVSGLGIGVRHFF